MILTKATKFPHSEARLEKLFPFLSAYGAFQGKEKGGPLKLNFPSLLNAPQHPMMKEIQSAIVQIFFYPINQKLKN